MATTNSNTEINIPSTVEERKAQSYADNMLAFRLNALTCLVVMPCLLAVNLLLSPGVMWIKWVAFGWGLSFVLHAMVIKMLFGIYDHKWLQREADRFRNRQH